MQFSYAIFACILAVTFITVTDGNGLRKGLDYSHLEQFDKTKYHHFKPRSTQQALK
ncbi:hypothetical protein Plhal304r1_c022g0076441 [Plasmopara halstedii]